MGWTLAGQRCVVQGFGNVGGVAAGELDEQGARVVAVSDLSGGVYDEDVQPWSGQFQGIVSFDFAAQGFLVEAVNVSLPFWAAALPFRDGRSHKELMLRLRNVASWHTLTHDHGSGRIV